MGAKQQQRRQRAVLKEGQRGGATRRFDLFEGRQQQPIGDRLAVDHNAFAVVAQVR